MCVRVATVEPDIQTLQHSVLYPIVINGRPTSMTYIAACVTPLPADFCKCGYYIIERSRPTRPQADA